MICLLWALTFSIKSLEGTSIRPAHQRTAGGSHKVPGADTQPLRGLCPCGEHCFHRAEQCGEPREVKERASRGGEKSTCSGAFCGTHMHTHAYTHVCTCMSSSYTCARAHTPVLTLLHNTCAHTIHTVHARVLTCAHMYICTHSHLRTCTPTRSTQRGLLFSQRRQPPRQPVPPVASTVRDTVNNNTS